MAEEKAATEGTAPSAPAKEKDSLRLLTLVIKISSLIIGIAILVVSRYAFTFFLISMLPTIVSTMVDKRMNKFASSTISAFNLVGVMPFLFEIGRSPSINTTAQHMITNIYIWFAIYSSAALGWVCIWAVPQITGKIFVTRATLKIKHLENVQHKLVEEWGNEIKRSASD
jgi:hypothetical protein